MRSGEECRRGFAATEGVGARRDHAEGRGREDSPATTGKSLLHFLFTGVCVNDCGRRLSIKIESFKCCRVSGFIRDISFVCFWCI